MYSYSRHTGRASGAHARPARRAGDRAAGLAAGRRPRPAPPASAACRGTGSPSALGETPTALEHEVYL